MTPVRHFDEVYQYDGLHQFKDFDRGTGQTIVNGTLKAAQEWTLDRLGNWWTFMEDSYGIVGWNINHNQTHNWKL